MDASGDCRAGARPSAPIPRHAATLAFVISGWSAWPGSRRREACQHRSARLDAALADLDVTLSRGLLRTEVPYTAPIKDAETEAALGSIARAAELCRRA